MRIITVASLVCAALVTACSAEKSVDNDGAADRVYLNGVVYTADKSRTVASAIAVRGDKIVYVGNDDGVQAMIGDDSIVMDLDGKMVLPGLHDMHIHPAGIVESGDCDLQSDPMDLAGISATVAACIDERALAPGEWLPVEQWNFAIGNTATAELSSLREALDVAAPQNPVILWGNDGHHGAVNSLALARGTNSAGEQIGISQLTLASDFKDYRDTIGVDVEGEPNGEIHETARLLVQPPAWGSIAGPSPEVMPLIARELAQNGLTSIQDAAMPLTALPAYKALVDAGNMSFRLSAAIFQDVPHYSAEDGTVNVDAMVAKLETAREQFRKVPYIQVETAKIFVDGVIEGNPLNNPPTLPNAAMLNNYQQPVFDIDLEKETVQIRSYVELHSEVCQQVRLAPDIFLEPAAVETFIESNGYHPGQCRISRGVLENPAPFIKSYMRALDEAGFNIHAHVIGDRAVRTALDGFDFSRQENGPTKARHSLGHIQVVAPEDYARIGKHRLYLVFTYAWIAPEFFYDLTVNPFVERLDGIEDLYSEDNYYMRNAYPAAQLEAGGAILAGGSDAPVDTRDPRPFFNIQQAVTRANEDGMVLNAANRVDIQTALDAYTINGARMFGHDAVTGSLEVGKLADLVVVDRDLIKLAETGRANEIVETQVLQTLFEGRPVFEAQ